MYEKELKKICEAAENRWNKGGKELYEAMQNSLKVEQSPEYKKIMGDNQLEIDFWKNIPLSVKYWNSLYDKMKNVFENFDESLIDDGIYALGVSVDWEPASYPYFNIIYNTHTTYISTDDDTFFEEWIQETPYYNLFKQYEYISSIVDYDYLSPDYTPEKKRICELHGLLRHQIEEFVGNVYMAAIVFSVEKLLAENVIEKKFGKNILFTVEDYPGLFDEIGYFNGEKIDLESFINES